MVEWSGTAQWLLVAAALSAFALSDAKDIMSRFTQNLRIFVEPDRIVSADRECSGTMETFGKCVAGDEDFWPSARFGRKFLSKVKVNLDNMRAHPNVKHVVEANEAIEANCFDRSCVATPQSVVDCLLDSAINGEPWNAVTTCMKQRVFRTPDVDLSVPKLGSMEKTKKDLRMLMAVALYRYWFEKEPRSPGQALLAKLGGLFDIFCPGRRREVEQCIRDEMSQVRPGLNMDIVYLTSNRGRSTELTFAEAEVEAGDELTLLGDEQARNFIVKKLFLQQVAGCAFHFIPGNSIRPLVSRKPCAYHDVPTCFHYMWTLKNGICECRRQTTSNPSLDPLNPADLRQYIRTAQRDFIRAVRNPNWDCHLTGSSASSCEDCVQAGNAMFNAFTQQNSEGRRLRNNFADTFKEEIEIVLNMLKDLCSSSSVPYAEPPCTTDG